MTSKLTITRERLEALAVEDDLYNYPPTQDELNTLARMALAAMDSEPVGKPFMYGIADPDGNAYIDEFCVSEDLGLVEDTVNELNYDREEGDELNYSVVALYRHAQPAPEKYNIGDTTMRHIFTPTGMTNVSNMQAVFDRVEAVLVGMEQPAPVVPEVLPCPVLLEPGLRFGKGIKTSTLLAALARRAVYESDMAALSPEEKLEFQTKIADFKALLSKQANLSPDFDAWFNGPDAGLRVVNYHIQRELQETAWKACRATMIQAGNSPVIPDGWKLVPVEPNGDMLAAAQDAYGETEGDIASTLRAAIAAAPQEVKP